MLGGEFNSELFIKSTPAVIMLVWDVKHNEPVTSPQLILDQLATEKNARYICLCIKLLVTRETAKQLHVQ